MRAAFGLAFLLLAAPAETPVQAQAPVASDSAVARPCRLAAEQQRPSRARISACTAQLGRPGIAPETRLAMLINRGIAL
ncbi:hypothetical protein, partial [Sandarakinorhabdus rubra]|uniref:hypothetical protein n=1 Tax=Sandarakinorhabdus rubra TaxID=2672568 RepID=UPI0013D8E72F